MLTALTACACSSAPRVKGATTRGLRSYAVLPPPPLRAVAAHRSAASVEARRSRSPSPRTAAAVATKTIVASLGRSDQSMVCIIMAENDK